MSIDRIEKPRVFSAVDMLIPHDTCYDEITAIEGSGTADTLLS